jgi:hypothetical protein
VQEVESQGKQASQPAGSTSFLFFESNVKFYSIKKTKAEQTVHPDQTMTSNSHRGDHFLIQEKKINNFAQLP